MRKFLLLFLAASLASYACSRKQDSPASKENYIGNWKVIEAQGNTYYMTLNADGTGTSTRDGGESGKWSFQADHIALEWNPKAFKLYFDPGGTKPMKAPTVQADSSKSIAVPVEKIP